MHIEVNELMKKQWKFLSISSLVETGLGVPLTVETPKSLIASGQVKNIESLRLFLKSCI